MIESAPDAKQVHSTQSQAVEEFLRALQQRIIGSVEAFESSARFQIDAWQKPPIAKEASGPQLGGGGLTAVLKDGAVFEQAGVGFSDVHGSALPPSASQLRPELAGRSFRALGVSVVIHPRNPYVPTSHMNVRYFEASKGQEAPIWWFGGGFDLTPFYPFDADVAHWHQVAAELCTPFGSDRYALDKAHCDRYFYLKHRAENRGIGGLFFDDLSAGASPYLESFEACFAYQRAVGLGYLDALMPIVDRRKDEAFGERESAFQLYRRGRYVEFNLVWDRGTLFGLQSGGRTESILMSLPPRVRFEYGYQPEASSAEARLQEYLKPRDWLQELAHLVTPKRVTEHEIAT